jgi:branched-chain amino acid transport system permease protein
MRIAGALLARGGLLALLATAPLFLSDFRTILLTEILIFGLFAASLDLLVGYTGMPSLGHQAFLGIGAYGAALFAIHVTPDAIWQLGVATAAAAAAAAALGVVAARTRGVYFLMLTLAIGQLFYQLTFDWDSVTGGSNGLYGMPLPTLPGGGLIADNDQKYWYVLACFAVGYGVLWLVVRSPFGRALTGIRENEARMSSLGYNVALFRLAVFAIAGGMAGYAGALTEQQQQYVSPSVASFDVLVLVTIAIIVGGRGTLLGPVLGTAFVYIVRDQLSDVLSQHWPLLLGAVFVLAVYFLPSGLVGAGRWLRSQIRRRRPVAEALP